MKNDPKKTASLIDPGQPAPAFALPDQSGTVRRLEDFRGRWLVLYFYPKDSTPGCTEEACGFRDAGAAYDEEEVAVLGVSPDPVASHAKFAEQFGLPFPLLADEGSEVCQAYGVWQEKAMFGRRYMGVVRTTYLIDPRGRVAQRWDRVKVGGHAEAVLQSARDLAGAAD